MAEEAKTADETSLELLVAQLGGSHRRGRQEASRIVAAIAKASPDAVLPYADDLVDALDRPEAQTRWQVLEALTALSAVDAQAAAAALDGAEASLFDEDSPIVRLAAFKFLAALGARSKRLSTSVWPLLDEAVHRRGEGGSCGTRELRREEWPRLREDHVAGDHRRREGVALTGHVLLARRGTRAPCMELALSFRAGVWAKRTHGRRMGVRAVGRGTVWCVCRKEPAQPAEHGG